MTSVPHLWVAAGDPDEWDKLFKLNVSAPLRLTRRLAPSIVERTKAAGGKGGAVITTGEPSARFSNETTCAIPPPPPLSSPPDSGSSVRICCEPCAPHLRGQAQSLQVVSSARWQNTPAWMRSLRREMYAEQAL